MPVQVRGALLFDLLLSARKLGEDVLLDDDALRLFLREVELGQVAKGAQLTIYEDGEIEFAGRPVAVTETPGFLIRLLHSHGPHSTEELRRRMGGISASAVSQNITRANRALAWTPISIARFPSDKRYRLVDHRRRD